MRKRRNPTDTSFFEISRSHQKNQQSTVIKEIGKTAELPYTLAKSTHALAQEFMDKVGNLENIACKSGCSSCCHQPATVFPFEALQIAHTLRTSLTSEQLGRLQTTMKIRVSRLRGTSVRANINDKTPCPLLQHGRCSIYADRPLTCRMTHSFSVAACQRSFEGDRFRAEIPISLGIQTGIGGIIEGAYEGIPDFGLDGNLYELCSAVLTALEIPDAGQRWASGDQRVFAKCVKDDT